MFFTESIQLPMSAQRASLQLDDRLGVPGVLQHISEDALQVGLHELPAALLPPSVDIAVQRLPPYARGDVTVFLIRWVPVLPGAGSRPILDGNIEVRPADHETTALTVLGTYHLPTHEWLSSEREQPHRRSGRATATMLLTHIAELIESPAPEPG